MKQILVKRGEVNELTNLFKCSRTTVIHALRFRRHAEIHIKVRKVAIERGGVEVK